MNMDLATYLRENDLTDTAFAKLVERDRSNVTRWRTLKTRPDWDAIKAIEKATEGAVTAGDFAAVELERAS